VRWISTTSFEENLRGAYGGGEGTNGTEGRIRQGRGALTSHGRGRVRQRGGREWLWGGAIWLIGGVHDCGTGRARQGGGRERLRGGTHVRGGGRTR
jgi:hypothetical protein